MAGPCVSDGNCTDFWMNGANLQVDVLISDKSGNCISCDNTEPNRGLYVPCHRSRFKEGISATPTGAHPSVTSVYGGVKIDVKAFGADVGNGAGPVELTNTTTTTYTNSTLLTELVEFDFVLGPTEFILRGGWDFKVGLKTSWWGLADIAPVSSFRSAVGFNTGQSAYDLGIPAAAEPAGVSHPTYYFRQNAEIAPGETLTLQHRMYAEFVAQGYPDSGTVDQVIFTTFGSAAHIRAWTKG